MIGTTMTVATIEELFGDVFSVWSVPKSYKHFSKDFYAG
jgi:hypothetical protein